MPRRIYRGQEEEIKRLYIEEEKSLGDISKVLGGTRQGVQNVLKGMGVKLRSRSEARLIALQKKKFATHTYHQYNRGIFNEWNPMMAYMVGLTYASGSVHRAGVRFVFGKKTMDIAENICKIMESNRLPKEIDNNGFPGYLVMYDSYEMTERLREIGAPWGKKSSSLRYPRSIPEELDRHFIRGFWDGHGKIKRGLMSFHSESIIFLEGIRYHLSCLGVPTDTGIIESSGVLTYGVGREIYDLFYDGVSEHCYSSRKREKFKNSLTEIS